MNATELIDRYCDAWNDPAPARRTAHLALVWANGATYTDPSTHAAGSEELLAHIVRVRARRPGGKVLRTSVVDIHHGICRFAWKAVDDAGVTLADGIDIAFFSADGSKIERVIGFFDPLAAA